MKKLNRALSLVLAMCLITTSVVIFPSAEETNETVIRPCVTEVPAGFPDQYSGLTLTTSPYGYGMVLGSTAIGSWAKYDNIDFGDGDISEFLLNIGVHNDYAGGTVSAYIDSMSNEPVASMVLPSTGGWNEFTWLPATINNTEIIGVHTVYISFTGKRAVGNIMGFKFSKYVDKSTGVNVPSDIKGTEYESAYGLLSGIGVIENEGKGSYAVKKKVTAEELLKLGVRIMDMEASGDNIAFLAAETGVSLQDDADLKAAAKIATYIMGYIEIARLEKDYESACVARAEINNVFDNVETSKGILTKGSLLMFAYNLLKQPKAVFVSCSDGWIMRSLGEKTVLESYHDVYRDIGIVDGNKYTNLTGPPAVSEGFVSIDKIRYKENGTGTSDMLGRRVRYYYTLDNTERTLVYAEDYKNSIVVVEDDDVISYSQHSLKYYNEKDKLKTLKTDNSVDLIYNGMARLVYNESIFTTFNGTLTLIDNDGDGKYEVVHIFDTYDMVVDYISDGIIYEKHGSKKIDFANADVIVRDQYGNYIDKVALENLSGGNVLTVAEMSAFGYKGYDITIARRSATGTVESIKDDIITVGGRKYIMSDKVKYSTSDSEIPISDNTLFVGDGVILYLNAAGEVVLVNFTPTPKNYGYMIGCGLEPGFNKTVRVKIYTQDGEMLITECRSAIEIDGKKYKNPDEINALLSTLCGSGALVIYSVNNDGYIISLDFAYDYTGTTPIGKNSEEKDNSLHLTYLATNDVAYNSGSVSFSGYGTGSDTAVVFCIPPSGNDEYYRIDSVSSVFLSGSLYKVKAYSADVNKLTSEVYVLDQFTSDEEFFKVINSIGESSNDNVCYVVSLSRVLDEAKDTVVTEITYYTGGELKTVLADDTVLGTASGLGVGDIVRIQSKEGYANNIVKMFDYSTKAVDTTNTSDSFTSGKGCRYGTVKVRKGTYFILNEYNEVHNASTARIYVYENTRNGGSIIPGTVDDILDTDAVSGGSEIVLSSYSGKVLSILVIR